MSVIKFPSHLDCLTGMGGTLDEHFHSKIVSDNRVEGGRLLTLEQTHHKRPEFKLDICIVVPEGLSDYAVYREQAKQQILAILRNKLIRSIADNRVNGGTF